MTTTHTAAPTPAVARPAQRGACCFGRAAAPRAAGGSRRDVAASAFGPPLGESSGAGDAAAQRSKLAEEYGQAADKYDERWAAYTAATVEAALSQLPQLPASARVVDLACGTGALLRGLVERKATLDELGEYIGVDNSAGMLAVAERRVRAEVLPFSTRWLLAAADEPLPLPDACCDAVVCANSFHFFADPATCLAECARVLKPGGTLLIADWCSDFWTCRALELYLRLTGRATSPVLGEKQLRRLVDDAAPGLQTQSVTKSVLLTFWGFMTLVARKEAAP